MKFEQLDRRMRVYETAHDHCVLPGVHIVARIDGRSFQLFFDGDRLRLVAWRTPKAVYWVSNTLLQTLTNAQMLAIAGSLTRVGAR